MLRITTLFLPAIAALCVGLFGCTDEPTKDETSGSDPSDVADDVQAGDIKTGDIKTGDIETGDGGDAADAGSCPADTCECVTTADCADKDDGDLCNGVLFCDVATHTCEIKPGTVNTCTASSSNPCQYNACEPKTGKCRYFNHKDGKACDDGKKCTAKDACKLGGDGVSTCMAGEQLCGCEKTSDCAKHDDPNPCKGKHYCDKEGFPFACKVNPASVVACSTLDDTTCRKSICDPKDKTCSMMPVADATACDVDGNACTADVCKAGSCEPGPIAGATCACNKLADCAKFEDGNACNGTLYCHKASASCVLNPATIVSCSAIQHGPCQHVACKPKTGTCAVELAKEGTVCDDGQPCTDKPRCKKGVCTGGKLTCTCTKTADCAAVDDSDLCNGVLYCDKKAGVCRTNPATIKRCPAVDKLGCVVPRCQPKTGECAGVQLEDGTVCEADGTDCTGVDTCAKGVCKAGPKRCGCTETADCAKAEDGDACNGTLFCDVAAGKCLLNPKTVVTCSGGATCKPSTCDAKTGKCAPQNAKDGALCDLDGYPCTVDRCQAGTCKAGPNDCWCGVAADCAQFDDGNACNGTLFCNPATKIPSCQVDQSTIASCPTALPGACTGTVCDPKTGSCVVTPAHEGQGCDDGALCTKSDVCKAGKCAGVDAGVTQKCDDGDKCTALGTCVGGSCAAGSAITCNDANACTDDSCESKTGCLFKNNANVCDDGLVCSANDSCQGGACKAGAEALWAYKTDQAGGGFTAAIDLANGSLAVVGTLGTGNATTPTMERLDTATGKRLHGVKFAKVAGGASRFGAVTVYGGKVFAVGAAGPAAKANGFVGIADFDKKTSSSQVLTGGVHGELSSVAIVQGVAVACGAKITKSGGDSDAWLVRLGKDGKEINGGVIQRSGDQELWGIDALPGGGYVAVGETVVKGTKVGGEGWVLFGHSHGPLFGEKVFGGSKDDRFREVIALPDGGVIIGGSADAAGGVGTVWIVGLNPDQTKRFEDKPFPTSAGQVGALLRHDSRLFVGHNASKDGASSTARLAIYDIGLTPIIDRLVTLEKGAKLQFLGALAIGDSKLFMAGSVGSSASATRGVARRLDLFGNDSCAASNACFTKGSACVDSKPCTTDHCNGKGACVHATIKAGTDCDDGKPCTFGDRCNGNSACSGRDRVWEAIANNVRPTDVLAQTDGRIVMVGVADNGKTATRPWISRYDGGGKPLDPGPIGGDPGAINGIAERDNQALVAVGQTSTGGTKAGLWLLASNGDLDKLVPFNKGKKGEFDAVAVRNQLGAAVGVRNDAGTQGGSDGMVVLFDTKSGQVAHDVRVGGPGDDRLHDVIAAADNFYAVGSSVSGAKHRPWFVRIDHNGKVVIDHVYAQEGQLRAIAPIENGAVVGGLLGHIGKNATELIATVGVGGGFGLMPAATSTGKSHAVFGLAVDPEGYVAQVGRFGDTVEPPKNTKGRAKLWQAGLGDLRAMTLVMTDRTTLVAATHVPGVGWAMAGWGFKAPGYNARLLLTDRWFSRDCKISRACVNNTFAVCGDTDPCTDSMCINGKCSRPIKKSGTVCADGSACTISACANKTCSAKVLTAKCDDGNVCTTDSCDAKKGCQHVAAADGISCDDGDPCTGNGECKSGACAEIPRHFEKLFSHPKAIGTSLHGIAIDAQGQTFVAATVDDGAEKHGLVALFDGNGQNKWLQTYDGGKGKTYFNDAAFGHDHPWVVVGEEPSNGPRALMQWRDATGAVKRKLDPIGTPNGRLYAIERVKGGFVLGGEGEFSGKPRAWIALVGKDGKSAVGTWVQDYTGGSSDSVVAVAAHPNGTTGGALNTTVAGGQNNFGLLWVSANGTAKQASPVPGFEAFASVVAPRSNGGFLLGGNRPTAAKMQGVWATFDNKGGFVASGDLLRAGGELLPGAIVSSLAGNNDRVLLGIRGNDKPAQASLVSIGPWGVANWQQTYPESIANSIGAMFDDGDGVRFAGVEGDKIWLGRMTWFGHKTCAAAGKCLGLSADKCDDKKTCTADQCIPASGCKSSPTASKLVCGPKGDKCDTKGVCSP